MKRILSYDRPAKTWLCLVVLAIVVLLAAMPLINPPTRSLNMTAKIIVFIPLAASFILLVGYTGIVSFAHTIFFGIGGYAVGIGLLRIGSNLPAVGISIVLGMILSAAVALVIALLSLRVRAIYFAMVTLVAALVVGQLASRMTWLTGGQDGILFTTPSVFSPGTTYFIIPIINMAVTGKVLLYYLLFFVAALCFLCMLRIVNSPFGRVLQAIRENEFRARSLGYETIWYKTTSTVLSAVFATIAGGLYALWLGYIGPGSTLQLHVLTDILLMIVIGGSGSLYGAIIGALLIILAETYLQGFISAVVPPSVVDGPLGLLLSGDRWLLWLGVIYVCAIYVIPDGIIGTARRRAPR